MMTKPLSSKPSLQAHKTNPLVALRRQRQWGGTFVGIIIGLILGVGIAALLALYITKAPVPFLNKAPSRPADKPLNSNEPLPDPNKPMYGSHPAKPGQATQALPPGIAPAPNAVPPAAGKAPVEDKSTPEQTLDELIAKVRDKDKPAPAAAPTTAPKDKAADKTVATDKPAADKAAADKNASAKPAADKAAPAATGTAPVAGASDYQRDNDPYVYYLQAGAFKDKPDAETQKGRLALLGFDGKIVERDVGGSTVYRVRVGPYGRLDDMNRVRAKLTENEIEASVVRMPKP